MDSISYIDNIYTQPQTQLELKDESLDAFISQRSGILNSKLEIFMQEIQARLAIKNKNIGGVDHDMEKVKDIINELSPRAHYINDSTEKDEFHKMKHTFLELGKEKRDQDTSCWNDIVPVIRDLLNTWEAHQQSSARAQLLANNGIEAIVNEAYSGGQPVIQ
jgi:flagellin-specific chaperone FliS